MRGMRSWARGATVVLATVAMVGAGAAPALAAPPGNDVARRAVPIYVPLTLRQDTTEATTDAIDAKANRYCGAPATDASVWYSYTPDTDQVLIIDVSRSDYSAGVLVTTGGSLGLVGCGPITVLVSLTAGQTYYIVAFDDQLDGGGNGGNLVISFLDGGGTPTVDVNVNPNGRLDGQGNALVRGSYTCTNGDSIELFGDLLQLRLVAVRGSFGFVEDGTCDGVRRTWPALVEPTTGRFGTGEALLTTFGFVCGRFLCSEGYAERVIRLRAATSG